MNLTAEEKLMYEVMKAIFDSGIHQRNTSYRRY